MSQVALEKAAPSPTPHIIALLHGLPSLVPAIFLLTLGSPELHTGTPMRLGPYLLIKTELGALQERENLLGLTPEWICFPPISWKIELDL